MYKAKDSSVVCGEILEYVDGKPTHIILDTHQLHVLYEFLPEGVLAITELPYDAKIIGYGDSAMDAFSDLLEQYYADLESRHNASTNRSTS
jgi:hypothetical protein